MNLQVEIESGGWSVGPAQMDEQTDTSIQFQVIPMEPSILRLETGEIFLPRRDSDKTDDDVDKIGMSIYRGTTETGALGRMNYHDPEKAYSARSIVHVSFSLNEADFDELMSNLKSGLKPSRISFGTGILMTVEEDKFGFNMGSDIEDWKTKSIENQEVELRYIRFDYTLP
jgi:hypothetical protein